MIRRLSLLFGLFLLVAVLVTSAFARPEKAERKANPLLNRMTYYSFPNIDADASASTSENPAVTRTGNTGNNSASLQTSVAADPSPGVTVGNTVYEYQSNGSNKRQVQISHHAVNTPIIHFDWMYSPDMSNAASETGKRTVRYNSYNAEVGIGDFMAGGAADVSPVDERTGYVVGDVNTTNGEYMAVGHHRIAGQNQTRVWWDQGPGLNFWVDNRLTDAVGNDPDPGADGTHFIWPACVTQNYLGQTITHIVAHESAAEQIKYFRKVGVRETGTWVMTLILDTANNLGYTCYASKTTGKVVLGWMANIRATGGCDTCSQSTAAFVQADNDVYVKSSTDAGATWGPKKNVTLNVDGVAGYRAYYDLSVMIDELDKVIAVWPARQWPSDAVATGSVPAQRCRIQFWKEDFAPGVIRTVAGLEWDQTDCTLGAFKMNAGRTQLARCNGRTYVLWEQGNDFNAGIMDDCAERAGVGGNDDPAGAANSDLYVSVSEDNGVTWDPARNITHTRTPGCDSATGTGGACQSEVYPTVTPFGHNFAGDYTANGNQTPIPIPGTAGSNSGYHLEIQYILDPHAGGAIRPEGPWFLADVKWARLECDSSVKTPVFTASYNSIGYPAWVKHGQFRDTAFKIENTGNQNLSYTVAKYETAGPAGHLTFSGFSGSVPSGFSNTETGQIRLNSTVVNVPGTIVQLKGGLVFTSNAPSSPDTVKIVYYVVDTIVAPKWDTIFVASASKFVQRKGLAVSNSGEFAGGRLRRNLDFAQYGDCDTTARRYLSDASPTITYLSAGDTAAFYNFSEDGYVAETGLRPIKGPKAPREKDCIGTQQNFALYYGGRFTTADTNVTMEQTWYAPIQAGTGSQDSAWFIQCLKVFNTSGAPVTQLAVGEIADWDIPTDSGTKNSGGLNPLKKLIYQQGAEWDDTSDNEATAYHDCQNDDRRFGGTRYLLGSKQVGLTITALPADPSGAIVEEYSRDIGGDGNLNKDSLIVRMQETGFATTDSVTDNVILLNFAKNQTLGITDTLRFYTAWLSVRDGDTTALFLMADRANNWFTSRDIKSLSDTLCICCVKEGNFNHDASLNVVDVTSYVARLFQGGPPPFCAGEADNNDDASVNIVDLTRLVAFLFTPPNTPLGSCP